MKFHHLGYACSDINQAIEFVQSVYSIKTTSEVIYDEQQKAQLCLLTLEEGYHIELVSGESVEQLLHKGIHLYHTCYEVSSLEKTIADFKQKNAVLISPPKPAKLFNNRRVCFLQTEIGLIELLEKQTNQQVSDINIIINATFTIDPLLEPLNQLKKELDINHQFKLAPYNQIFQTLLNSNSEIQAFHLIYIRMEDWLDKTKTNAESLLKEIIDDLLTLLNQVSKNITCIVYFCPSELKDPFYQNLFFDLRNQFVQSLSESKQVFCVDVNQFLGHKDIFDPIRNKIGHVPYTENFFSDLALISLRSIHALQRKPYKLILLDCDNTLWSGVAAEAGSQEIKLSEGYLLFQKKILALFQSGMLFGLVSKNNEATILDVFSNNKDILLKKEHFVCFSINWNKKSKNIQEISEKLNIGIEDIVFIDDNPIECAEVRSVYPELLVFEFPKNEKAIIEFCQANWIFDFFPHKKTEEDEKRTLFYQQEQERVALRKNVFDFREFINKLNLSVNIYSADMCHVERIAQLTERVNQFNFSAKIYSQQQILQLIKNQNIFCFLAEASDRFGHYGLVGVVIFFKESDTIIFDNFLLSCRAFGKGIEHEMLRKVASHTEELGIKKIRVPFKATGKNIPALNFLEKITTAKKREAAEGCEYEILTTDALRISIEQEGNEKQVVFKKINFRADRVQDNKILQKAHCLKLSSFSDDEIIDSVSIEDVLISIWESVLRRKNISHDDNYFDLGGDSLLATLIIAKIYQALKIEISLIDIFHSQTIPRLAQRIRHLISNTEKANHFSLIEKSELSHQMPLSFSQQWLWMLDQLDESSWYYNMPASYLLCGKLNITALQQAFCELIKRHQVLRTVFRLDKNKLYQHIYQQFDFPLRFVDAINLNQYEILEILNAESKQPFDLSKDVLIRVLILKMADQKNILHITKHHVVSDGWSYAIMHRELSHFYNHFVGGKTEVLPELPIQYVDFAQWQQEQLTSNKQIQELAYWREKLGDLPTMNFPTDYPRSNKPNHEGKYFAFEWDTNLSKKLLSFASEQRTSLFNLVLSVFVVVLASQTQQDDLVIVSPSSGRHHPQTENLIGCFVNLLILRIKIQLKDSFLVLIQNLHTTALEAFSHQEVPFEKIIKDLRIESKTGQNSLFQVMFALQNTPKEQLSFQGIQASDYRRGYDAARLELILELETSEEEIVGGFYYNTNIYAERTIKKIVDAITAVANSIVKNPEIKVEQLIHRLNEEQVESNENIPVPVHVLFEQQASKTPHNTALQLGNQTLTYIELNQRADALAHYLQTQGVVAKQFVALAFDPSFEQIISVLACFKLGAAYVPLDLRVPKKYLNNVLVQVQPSVILTLNQHINLLETSFPVIKLDEMYEDILCSSKVINSTVSVNDLAYIIFTSGSTGQPKGVMIPHANIFNLLTATKDIYHFNQHDVTALFHSYAFDFSVWEMWIALAYGGKLILLPHAISSSIEDFHNLIQQEKITVLNQTPSAFYQLSLYQRSKLSLENNALRLLILGGETLDPTRLEYWLKTYPNCRAFNMYGITEVTVHASYQEITLAHTNHFTSLIGKALPGYELFILNEQLQIAQPGEVGEIYVGGKGLAQGYYQQDELNQRCFIQHIFHQNSNLKLYKSGDLARYTPDGNIEFLGRSEHQAKIRGHRVDLSGVNYVLQQHEGVDFAHTHLDEQNQLHAYLVPSKQNAFFIYQLAKLWRAYNKFCVLPNGLTIAHLNQNETNYLYEEIFVRQDYLLAHLNIRQGDCIVDVGANIGMFSLLVNLLAKNLTTYAIEPIKDTFDILQLNGSLYGFNIHCFNMALSHYCGQTTFTHYPQLSILSGAFADKAEDKKTILHYLHNIQQNDFQNLSEILDEKLISEQQVCETKTLSRFMEEKSIDHIDLLKIDVEKSELSILEGIQAKDWKKIKQIIVEVHDTEKKIDRVIGLLKQNGFHCEIYQDAFLSNTALFTVFATRYSVQESYPKNISLPQTWNNVPDFVESIKTFLRQKLPEYMIPMEFHFMENIKRNQNGKIDFDFHENSLLSMTTSLLPTTDLPVSDIEKILCDIWSDVLGKTIQQTQQNFFDLGGNSLLLIQVYTRINDLFPNQIRAVDLFKYTTIKLLAEYLMNKTIPSPAMTGTLTRQAEEGQHFLKDENDIAIVGLAGRFPQAEDVEMFWKNVLEGMDCITRFDGEALKQSCIDPERYAHSNFVAASGLIADIDQFAATFFNINPRDAILMDPQQRIMLELAWHALENAGYCASQYKGDIGVYLGAGNNHYFDYLLKYQSDFIHKNHLLAEFGNEKDYLATRVAHKLNLTGSAININTACSTSLVAIIKACQSLQLGENDMVLAGGVYLLLPERAGYLYQSESILSPDGYCRPFAANSRGTVLGSGAGIVVLKRLSDALSDGDTIQAIIKGTAINNDGQQKIGFTAPSVQGQARCIKKALQQAHVNVEEITYIEAHGTGTILGDPIEIEALIQVFNETTQLKQFCAIGSVKSNIGHADAAAGIAGLMKVIKMLQHRCLPPASYFTEANPHIPFSNSPFYINTQLNTWEQDKQILHAGVSCFGIGGTNSHMVLQSAPKQLSDPCFEPQLIVISAKTETALNIVRKNLQAHLIQKINTKEMYEGYFADIAYTLQMGREHFEFRLCYICRDIHDAIAKLDFSENQWINTDTLAQQLVMSAKQWLLGKSVDWTALHVNQKRQRVPLPLYPFERKSYWYNHHIYRESSQKFIERINHANPFYFVEQTLVNIFRDLFADDTIQTASDFLELGGDSMFALSLVAQIKDTFDVNLNLDEVYQFSKISVLAGHILKTFKQTPGVNLVVLKKGDAQMPPLFIVHPPNGSLIHYAALIKYLSYDGIIYGIQNPPNENDFMNFPSIQNLATQYVHLIEAKIKNDFYLMGWSFGGVVAFEMAYQLEKKNQPASCVILLDAWAKHADRFYEEAFFEKLFSTCHEGSITIKQWHQIITHRLKSLLSYKPAIIKTPVILFKAKHLHEEYESIEEKTNHWKHYGDVKVIELDANHETILASPAVTHIADILKNSLAINTLS